MAGSINLKLFDLWVGWKEERGYGIIKKGLYGTMLYNTCHDIQNV